MVRPTTHSVCGSQRRSADLDGRLARERRQRHSLTAPEQHGRGLEDEGRADGGDDLREHALAQQRTHGHALEPDGERRDEHDRHHERGPQRHAEAVEPDGHHAPQHDQLALREVDDGGRVEDQREPDGRERVDGPVGQATEDVLEELVESHDCAAGPRSD